MCAFVKIPDTWQKEAPIWLELQGVKQPLVSVCIQAQPPSHSPFLPLTGLLHTLIFSFSCPFFFWGCDLWWSQKGDPQKVERKGGVEYREVWSGMRLNHRRPRTPATSACSPEHKGLHPCEFSPASQLAQASPVPGPSQKTLLQRLPILPLPDSCSLALELVVWALTAAWDSQGS